VEKSRRLYRFDDVEICFDEVLGLGEFVELEIKCEESMVPDAVEKMRKLAKELGLKEDIRDSYIGMIMGGV